jgi:hypothetical protein
MNFLRLLLLSVCIVTLNACSALDVWSTRREHDLVPGELKGTVYVGTTKLDPTTVADPNSINDQIAAILCESGLTRVMHNTGDWTFIWFDSFSKGDASGLNLSANYISVDRNYGHTFKGYLYKRHPNAVKRWTGTSIEIWGHPDNESTIIRRINRLMKPFPGQPGRKANG